MVKAKSAGSSVVTTQGQITIPKALRERLDLKAGDLIEFLLAEKDIVVLRKIEVKEEIEL